MTPRSSFIWVGLTAFILMVGTVPDGIGAGTRGVEAMVGAGSMDGTAGIIRAITPAFIVAISAMTGEMYVVISGKSGGRTVAMCDANSEMTDATCVAISGRTVSRCAKRGKAAKSAS